MSPQQNKALFLESKHGQFAVRDTDVPKPGPGQVLVRVEAAALNPIDWKIQAVGVYVEKYPAVMGSDGAGTVVELGEGVTSLAVGDRIAFQATFDMVEKALHGTFAQYITTPSHIAIKIPANVSFEAAASLPSGLPTIAFVLYNQEPASDSLKLTAPWTEDGKGKYAKTSALILGGSSSVGQYAIQFARLSGFSPILTTASLKHADYLKTLGATHVLDRALPADAVQAEATRLAGGLLNLVFDAVTTPETVPLGYALTAPDGDLVVVSPTPKLGGEDGQPAKKVHMARGLLALPANAAVGAGLLAALPQLLESGEIKANRTEVLAGGLGGIVGGLERLKNNQVSGSKLVVFPQETA